MSNLVNNFVIGYMQVTLTSTFLRKIILVPRLREEVIPPQKIRKFDFSLS